MKPCTEEQLQRYFLIFLGRSRQWRSSPSLPSWILEKRSGPWTTPAWKKEISFVKNMLLPSKLLLLMDIFTYFYLMMCRRIQALFSVLAQFVVEQLLQVIEPYNVMSANKWCHIAPKCEIVLARIYNQLINKEYFNWNCPVSKDYHLRYDPERTVDQGSSTPSPDAGARPQSQCTCTSQK